MHNAQQLEYNRFNVFQRIEHGVLLVSFTVLAITGLPQMFSLQPWAAFMIAAMGGIETVRIIHRAAAVLLIVGTIYHFVAVSYRVFVRRVAMTMLPGWQDVRDGLQALGYNVGLVKTPPRMGRYNFGEKIEYWAVIWGTVVMVITGFMLWNPIATTSFLPGQFIPAAKAAHGGEALLAVLSIITWHFYNVHVKRFNRSMFTGKISHAEMEEEHALELAEIERGQQREPDPEGVRRRRRLFTPVAAVITTILLIGLYFFVTYEQTAITTVPRQQVDVFTPLTPAPERVQ
ncbi:MAG TPA: cytochrome C [Chloroflexi bacterium]|nr:cytochrome C [Chloroflexota bacterium]